MLQPKIASTLVIRARQWDSEHSSQVRVSSVNISEKVAGNYISIQLHDCMFIVSYNNHDTYCQPRSCWLEKYSDRVYIIPGDYLNSCTPQLFYKPPPSPSAPSSPPQSLRGEAENATEVVFTWQPPPPVDINGVLLYYDVIVEELETGQIHQISAPIPELRMNSLHPYYTYECKVAAFTVGLGPFSSPFSVQTLQTRKHQQSVDIQSTSI